LRFVGLALRVPAGVAALCSERVDDGQVPPRFVNQPGMYEPVGSVLIHLDLQTPAPA